MDISEVNPGDVLVVADAPDQRPKWRKAGFWITLRARLRRESSKHYHVAVASHVDEAGTFWGIEARPGGVGYVDIAKYVKNPATAVNTEQPKTSEQRATIVEVAKGLLGTPYDWTSIVELGMEAINAQDMWRAKDFDGEVPAQLICSALASWVYRKVGLSAPVHPSGVRFTTPGEWTEFIEKHAWES